MKFVLFASFSLLFFQSVVCAQTSELSNQNPDCPKNLSVTLLPTIPKLGEILTATTSFVSQKYQPAINWSVSSGKITEGQGTPQIKASFENSGDGFVATVTLGAIPPECANTASASIQTDILGFVSAHLVDKYEIVPFRIKKERLDNLTVHLQNNPGAQALIIPESKAPNIRATKAFLKQSYNYLTKNRGVDSKDILLAIKKGDADAIQLYVVPQGAQTPISDKEAVFVKGENLLRLPAPRPKLKREKARLAN